jgi:hypothetical protein
MNKKTTKTQEQQTNWTKPLGQIFPSRIKLTKQGNLCLIIGSNCLFINRRYLEKVLANKKAA